MSLRLVTDEAMLARIAEEEKAERRDPMRSD